TEGVSIAVGGIQPDGSSGQPSLSADARLVAFSSFACNLVPLTICGHTQVYLHDRQTGLTRLVSAAPDGTAGNGDSFTPKLSADARHVAFASGATNLVTDDTNGVLDV